MRRLKSIVSLLAAILILALAPTALAASASYGESCAELVSCVAYGQTPIAEMKAELYLAATLVGGDIRLADGFEMCTYLLDAATADPDELSQAAYSLESTVTLSQAAKPAATLVTDENGRAVFECTTAGIYLVSFSSVVRDGTVYTASPFIAYVSEADVLCGECITAKAKTAASGERLELEVLKLWADACHPSDRPDSVELTLWCDGKLYDRITLPENGRWSHTWTQLDASRKWNITESPCEGYAAPVIERDGSTVTVTNRCSKTTPPESDDTLPSAGQLWWPVPIMLFLGVLLCVLGFILKRGAHDER